MKDLYRPSHADWTEAVASTRPFATYAVDWPVSRAVVDAGFRDSFREAHPDPRSVHRRGRPLYAVMCCSVRS